MFVLGGDGAHRSVPDVDPLIVRSALSICCLRHSGCAVCAKPQDLEVVERAIICQYLVSR